MANEITFDKLPQAVGYLTEQVERIHKIVAALQPQTAIDIRADYVAKNGDPSAAAPKIFFRYYYVNSSTGEKSGVMLAETTWTAAAAGGGD